MDEKFTTKITVNVLLKKNNKILLIKRKNTGYMDGKYAFLGGHVEEGESLRQAMVREVYEEGSIYLKEDDLTYICAIRNGYSNYINFYFISSKFDGIPKISEPDKEEEMIWVDIKNIPEEMVPNDKRAIYNYLNNIYLDEYNFKEKN